MTVVGTDKLEAFVKRHSRALGPVQAWSLEARKAHWRMPQDIKNRYRTADFLADNRVIFNVGGNNYRLVVKVSYQGGVVLVEWVGTHSEYNKAKF